MTKNETKRKRLEEIVKRVFNVFCYVVTTLAIAIGIAVGVTKCSGSAATETIAADPAERSAPRNSLVIRNKAYNLDEVKVFVPRYEGTASVDFDYLRADYDIPVSLSPTRRGDRYVASGSSANFSILSSGGVIVELSPTHSFVMVFRDLPVDSYASQYEYKLFRVYSSTSAGYDVNIYNRSSEYATGDNENLGTFSYVKIVFVPSEEEDYSSPLFDSFFTEGAKTNFTFNEAFNYNAPFNASANAVFGATSFDGEGLAVSWKDYSVGPFYSNGRFFDTIRWYAQSLAGGGALLIDGTPTAITRADMYFYISMYYRNSSTSEEILVNFRDFLPYNGGDNVYYSNSTTWVVPAYRNIVFLTELSDSMNDKMMAFNNNNQSTYGGGMVSGEVNDIFSLIGGAFTAWIPVLSLYILPNITIGTLLFVPLVALLVFAIIRIIKK